MLCNSSARETCAQLAAFANLVKPALLAPPVLSLQDKLDRIAHERNVLDLQRQLAQAGLCEGDRVRPSDGGPAGRLLIARDEQPPRLLVQAEDGTRSDYSAGNWRRA